MAGEDAKYIKWVRSLDCCAPVVACRALRCEAHHRTGAGMGLKAHDHESMPLCTKHHGDFHAGRGCFAGWTKSQRKDWQREQAANFRTLYLEAA